MRAAALRSHPSAVIRLPSASAASAAVLPIAGLAAYAGVLITRAASLSAATFLYSDAPESAYLGVGIVSGHHVTLPLHSEIVPAVLAGWLFGIPGGHVLVQLLGPALIVAAVLVVCATLRRLGAAWPVAAVAGLAAGPAVLWQFLWPMTHVFTLLAIALLVAAVVRLATRGLGRVAVVATSLAAGLALLGDQGFVVTGMLPLLVAAFALSRMRRDARPLLAIAAGAAIAWACGQGLLRLFGVEILISPTVNPGGFDPAHIPEGIASAVRGIGWMVTGSWYGADLPAPLGALQLVAGGVVPLVPLFALLMQIKMQRRDGGNAAPVVYCAFWTAVDALVVAAYAGLGLATSPESAHYLIPCLLAASACLPLLVAGRRSGNAVRAAAAGWAAFAAIGVVMLPADALAGSHPPMHAARVIADLEQAGLDRGYADYWMSHPLTWVSGERVHVYPVDEHCSANANALCRYAISDAVWYQPRGGPTFLVVRTSYRCVDSDPSAWLGPAQRVIPVDATTTIFVYNYDIASRLKAENNQGCIP